METNSLDLGLGLIAAAILGFALFMLFSGVLEMGKKK